MPLAAGTRLGSYEIVAPLGAGGMGEVYRARDPRLGRDVAIKLLPEAFASDPERLARFEREARLLASLQHANIAVLHGLEESGGRRYLVMECVEGESLAQRLRRGAPPLEETLGIARAVAAALEAAHEGGIVHRDLKPGNVMVTPGGDVKVLDFGLAKGGAASASDPSLSSSPTMTYQGTEAGVVLGTAAYMSPEQARGKSVDRRTDIWSFGCVLYECLTGRQAFAGETVSDIVARILQTEPEWGALPARTPERLRALLRRCLEKDAKRRLRDIGEARIEIEDLIAARSSASSAVPAAAARARAAGPGWPVVAVVALLAAAAGWGLPRLLVRPAPPAPVRFEVDGPPGQTIPADGMAACLSPDGRMLAFIATDSSGVNHVWVRRLGSLEPRELPGADYAANLFWSPDSRFIGFFANDEWLMKVAADGATPPERVCATKAARGGSWNRDGVILLAPYSNGGIYRTTASGGPLVRLTRPDSAHGVTGHRYPLFLPDGKHFLFSTIPAGPDGKGGLELGSLDGGPTRELARVEVGPAWAAPGWLVSTRNRVLVADRFDRRGFAVAGQPVTLGVHPQPTSYSGAPVVSASRNGTLAWVTSSPVPRRLAWFDLQGREVGTVPLPAAFYSSLSLARDGRHALLQVDDENFHGSIVLADLERGVTTRLSQPDEEATAGILSPDGTRAAYLDDLTQLVHLVSVADGSRTTLLAGDRAYKQLYGWTPDGRSLLYGRLDAVTRWDVWLAPVDGGDPKPLVRTPANEGGAGISANGRWLAYQSDANSGTTDEYLQSLVSPGMPYQVTVGGGGGGWPHTGNRFFFGDARAPGVVRAAEVREGAGLTLGPSSVVGRAPADAVAINPAPDDRRFLAIVPAGPPRPQTITVLEHWTSAIRKP